MWFRGRKLTAAANFAESVCNNHREGKWSLGDVLFQEEKKDNVSERLISQRREEQLDDKLVAVERLAFLFFRSRVSSLYLSQSFFFLSNGKMEE